MIARISSPGEDGLKMSVQNSDVRTIWDSLTLGCKSPITPIASGALDILRIEAGLLLFDSDMSGNETPKELEFDFTVDYEKENFIGKMNF